jgi:DNA transposition AAA+ family ATPase
MKENEKKAICEALKRYVAKYPSQNKAAASLNGTSAGTVSTILSGAWDKISDEMWRKIAAQVHAFVDSGEWKTVETAALQEMVYAMEDAQQWKNVTWVVGEAGCGKPTAARLYEEEHREVFYILCSEDMRRSDFVRTIARKVGIRTDGMSIRDMLDAVTGSLVQMDAPLLLFDEADKLIESVFHYFIDLYNRLEDKCGMVFFSTSYIRRRMKTGLQYDKKGYNEIHSRIGRKFFELEPTGPRDVYAVCVANGLCDRKQIAEVVQDSEKYDFDLRRVKKAVHRVKRMAFEQ